MAKLTKPQARNYGSFSGTLWLSTGLLGVAKPGGDAFQQSRNWVITGLLTIGAGCLAAYWTRKSNLITEYLVPDIVKEW